VLKYSMYVYPTLMIMTIIVIKDHIDYQAELWRILEETTRGGLLTKIASIH